MTFQIAMARFSSSVFFPVETRIFSGVVPDTQENRESEFRETTLNDNLVKIVIREGV